MARLVSCTLEPVWETWDDPGDYPSNAGSGPLPSYSYLSHVEGEAKFELGDKEWQELANGCEDELVSFVNDLVKEHNLVPAGVLSISKWGYILSASGLEVSPYEDAEYETDSDYGEPDPYGD